LILKECVVVNIIPFDLIHRSNHLYPKQGFNKDHSEVYSAWLDDLLQFQQVKWNFSYCGKFYLKRENSPDFLCMNAMHTLVFSHFIASKPGILQPLPLKLNFVPKFERSHVSECGTDLNRSKSFLYSLVISLDIVGYIPCPDPSWSLLMFGTDTFFYSMISSNTLSL
jgi:hypothetical protein